MGAGGSIGRRHFPPPSPPSHLKQSSRLGGAERGRCTLSGFFHPILLLDQPRPGRESQPMTDFPGNWIFFLRPDFQIFHFHTRQSASFSLEPRVNNFPSAKVVNISFVIATLAKILINTLKGLGRKQRRNHTYMCDMYGLMF